MRRYPLTIDLGLSRLRAVATRLGITHKPDNSFLYTITGTNGKGSTAWLLHHALRVCGYSVCRYTSPYLHHFCENYGCGEGYFSDSEIAAAVTAIDPVAADSKITCFEFFTLVAFWLLHRVKPDIIILEVGLGGRLDAVNLWNTDCALITSIGLDHQQWLGPTREHIAQEKVAIARYGKPLLCGDFAPPHNIAAHARKLRAPYLRIRRDFTYRMQNHELTFKAVAPTHAIELAKDRAVECGRMLKISPEHHFTNSNLALSWQGLQYAPRAVDVHQVQSVWQTLHVPGRMQRLTYRGSNLLLDVAHNPQAAGWLVHRLRRHQAPLQVIVGMMADKDMVGLIAALDAISAIWRFVSLQDPRAATAETLCDIARATSSNPIYAYPNIEYALTDAIQDTRAQTILITGSFHTVQALLSYLDAATE